jgi:hypothetical protein
MVTAFFFRIIRIVPAYNNPIIRIMQVIGLHLSNKHYVPWFNICMTLQLFFCFSGYILSSVGTLQTGYLRLQALSQDEGQDMRSHVPTCS